MPQPSNRRVWDEGFGWDRELYLNSVVSSRDGCIITLPKFAVYMRRRRFLVLCLYMYMYMYMCIHTLDKYVVIGIHMAKAACKVKDHIIVRS